MPSWPPRRHREQAAPALAEAAAIVGDPAVRNRGTIGGNVAHADPASDLPTVLVALGASFVASGPRASARSPPMVLHRHHDDGAGGRRDPHAVHVPAQPAGQGRPTSSSRTRRRATPSSARPRAVDGERTARARRPGGDRRLVPHARRAPAVERRSSARRRTPPTIEAAAAKVAGDLGEDVNGDIYASAEYRAAVAPVYVEARLGGRGAPTPRGACICEPLTVPASIDELQQALAREQLHRGPRPAVSRSTWRFGSSGRCFSKARPASARPKSPRCWPPRSTRS